MLLKKGTVIYPSHIGYYNFHYPDLHKKYELTIDTTVKDLPWAEYDNFIATQVVSPKDYLPYAVLWVEKPV
tara:strand:- start:754 stop:966 length:213 start_codon:yes stop_codon:yes gene_type:complete